MKIAVCLPIHFSAMLHTSFFINFINRLGELDPEKYNPVILFSTKQPIELAREDLVESALKANASHIWFIDTDQIIPKGTLDKLLEMDADIASGLYFGRAVGYWPVIRKWNKEKDVFEKTEDVVWDTIMEVDGVGLGCCLIKTDVFKEIKKPWFHLMWDKNKIDIVASEDLAFCKRATDAGFKILVNTKLVIGHIGGVITEKEFILYRHLRKMEKEKNEVRQLQDREKDKGKG